MDEQEEALDFQALRAKFQDKEFLLGPPKTKPSVPEKPKVIPPPTSPTHHLPSGARPSLLSSINHALESKTLNAPRVVFKDEKKDNKKLLIHNNSKAKEKSDIKPKETKDKTKESKEKLNENSVDHKEKNGKRLPFLGTQKESTAELVPVSPPPKAKTQRKKNILGFMKSSKKDPAESILDSPSRDAAGPALLLPVVSDADCTPEESIYSVPKPILPKITVPEPRAAVDLAPLSPIPDPPDFSPPPAIIPDTSEVRAPALQSETPPQIESPALPVSDLRVQNETVPIPPIIAPAPPVVAAPSPPSTSTPPPIVAPSPPPTAPPSPPPRKSPPSRAIPSPPPSFANSDPPEASAPSPSPPELRVVASSDVEAEHPGSEDTTDSLSKLERPISALSALERAGDMSTGKRTPPSDQRILSALEKARKKATSPLSSPIPPLEDFSSQLNPALSDGEFPPIDHKGKKPPQHDPQVNSKDHRTASPVLHNLTEIGSNMPIELLVVPPPPPRRVLPDPETLGPAPQKPDRPPSVNLSEFTPPSPLIAEETPAPPEFSEPDATDAAEYDDLADGFSQELPVSESGNEEFTGADVPDEPRQPEFYSNGISESETEVRTETPHEDDYRRNPPQDQPLQAAPNHLLPQDDPHTIYRSSLNESNENLYEAVRASPGKKKGKNGGKKQKGTLKNPYVESPQETVQEKPKIGRFGRSDKKHNSEKSEEKELKKKEKQRLEKEKKELKEKQGRERKEQKEREKREHEMKKKFNITGQEEAMYQAKVNVTAKGRRNDLPVKSGDIISIIRTTKCPKGKWLARDSSNTYGYVSVEHLELDFKEMLELGKKTPRNSTVIETETTDGKVLNNFSHSAESFSDDSDEWTCEDEPYSPAPQASEQLPGGHARTFSMPETGNRDVATNHQHSHSDMCDDSQTHARQEALQKLATFFNSSKSVDPAPLEPEPERSPTPVPEEDVSVQQESSPQETEFDPSVVILPPPDMYADSMDS